ncbi:lymphocyte cytosolic protein 2 isoform X1 [Python bivittatus]|uniref:Lymphocyte cytosolic protein 2 n=1 Tax=Python bivittatus TaxID=176946 RepID=A0A9F2NR45_PYTBI|nr:lymphocyte cytosolic protein 2 isoform X1 [Python bivittatus]
MDSRSTPYRSEVARWSPNDLADYFRRLNFKDCEKVVRKHNITGQRFLSMSENDIQKFPKLKVPILSKLSQEINRHEEKKSIFPKRTQIQKSPENTEYKQEDGDGWSSFDESDDYESPDDDQVGDGVDYETPDDQAENENDADYEPPPSNDEDILRNAIFPPKPIPATSEYIDRPATERGKTSLQPPIPPQRPGPSPVPGAPRSRRLGQPPFSSPSNNNENYRDKSANLFKPPAPFVDRSKKPPLDRPGPPFERESLGAGKRAFPEMALTPKLRSLAEDLAKIQKPPLPPTERYEKNSPSSRRVLPPIKNNQMPERQTEMEPDNIPQRPVPQPSPQPFNTFPCRTTKSQSNLVPLPPKTKPDLYTESISSSVSLPPRLLPSNLSRTFSKNPADSRPPLPIPSRPNAEFPKADNEGVEQCHKGQQNQKWYVADITRSDAEVALRNINQDGAFLVRDSSRKTVQQPFVLMVLYHNKVYNIQIRYQQEDQVYFLGTSLKGNEDFTSVADIIDYFRRMPLLLIDGKDRCSRKQCMLTYAAGTL